MPRITKNITDMNSIQAKRTQSTFSLQYNVSTSIQASPETIWSHLTNAAAYPTWNSTVDRIEGAIELEGV